MSQESEASIGLKIYLQDQATFLSGMGEIAQSVLSTSRSFSELAASIGVTSDAIQTSIQKALDATNALADSLQNAVAKKEEDTTASQQNADATNNQASAAKTAAQGKQDEADATNTNTAAQQQNTQAKQAAVDTQDLLNQKQQASTTATVDNTGAIDALKQQYLDLAGQVSNVASLKREEILTALDDLDVTSQEIAQMKDQAYALANVNQYAAQLIKTQSSLGLSTQDVTSAIQSLKDRYLELANDQSKAAAGAQGMILADLKKLGLSPDLIGALKDQAAAAQAVAQATQQASAATQQSVISDDEAEQLIQRLSQAYLELAGDTSNYANALRQLFTAQMDAAGADRLDIAKLQDQSNALATASEDTGGFAAALGGLSDGLMGALGPMMLLAGAGMMVVQPVAQGLTSLSTSAGNMEESFTHLGIATGATGQDMDALKAKIIGLADNSKFSTTEVADGFTLMSQRGYTAADITNHLGTAMVNLAQATFSQAQPSAILLTGTMQAFGASAQDAGKYSDALTAAFYHGIPSVTDLSAALDQVAGTAHTLGIPMESVLGALDTLVHDGMTAAQAGASLRYMLAGLSDPTSKAASELASLGVITIRDTTPAFKQFTAQLDAAAQSARKAPVQFDGTLSSLKGMFDQAKKLGTVHTDDTFFLWAQKAGLLNDALIGPDGKMKDIPQLWDQIGQAILKLPKADQMPALEQIFNIKAGQAADHFLDDLSQSDPKLKTLIGNIKEAEQHQIATTDSNKIMDDYNSKTAALGTTVHSLVDRGMQPFNKILGDIAGWILNVIESFHNMDPLTKGLIKEFAKLAGMGVLGLLLVILGALAIVLGLVGLVIASIALPIGMVIAAIQHWGDILDWITGKSAETADKAALKQSQMAQNTDQQTMKGANAAIKHYSDMKDGLLKQLSQTHDESKRREIQHQIDMLNVRIDGEKKIYKNADDDRTKQLDLQKKLHKELSDDQKGWFKTDIIDPWNNLIAYLNKQWKTGFEDPWNNIGAYLQKTWKTSFQDPWGNIISYVQKEWKTGFQDPWNNIGPSIQKSWNDIFVKPWLHIPHDMKTNLGDMGKWAYDAFIKPINDPIQKLLSSMPDWGKNMLKGFIDGILGWIPHLKDAINNVVGAISGPLEHHSPAKEGPLSDDDQWMPRMMQMHARGILNNVPLVQHAASMAASGIHAGFTSPTVARLQAAGASSGSGSGNTTINLQIDGKTVGTAVFNNLTGQMQLNGMTRSWR